MTSGIDYKLLYEFDPSGRFFENIITHIYQTILKKGDVVIDGGANYGFHTIPLAEKVTNSGIVFAFEPLQDVSNKLIKKLENIKQSNVIVIQKAISNFCGKNSFCHVKSASGYSGIKKRKNIPKEHLNNIRIIDSIDLTTLDNEISSEKQKDHKPVKFIKLDLEGGEYDALLGAKRILANDRPIIIFEDGGKHSAEIYSYSLSDFDTFFEFYRYETYDLFGRIIKINNSSNINHKPWYTIAVPNENIRISEFIKNKLINYIIQLVQVNNKGNTRIES